MKSPAFTDNRLKITLHAVLWIIIFIFPIYIFRTLGFSDARQLSHFYVSTITYGFVFYINYLVLVPNLYFNNKKWQYFVWVTAIIIVLFLLVIMVNEYWFNDHEREKQFDEVMKKLYGDRAVHHPPFELFKVVNYLFTSFMITGFALGLGFMERHREDEKQRKELEKEKLHSELAFLKNQISPHFFFNTLNNIYTLTSIDTPAAQESILKLSKLMRYLLYESENGETTLSHEIDFMTNYISLMKLRLSPKVDLNVHFPSEYIDVKIPPLLFISFIENAFKHGVGHREASFIAVEMNVENENIHFVCRNSSTAKSTQPKDSQHSGIGLENVQKRLTLLFPGKHHLKITQADQVFTIDLVIELKTKTS